MNGEGVLGVILSGGAGQRVGGADKGLLTLHGTPVVAKVAAVLRPQCDQLVIVANRNLDQYARVARTISDEAPGHAGPLAGIVAALALHASDPELAACEWLLTVPVDCPDFPTNLYARLRAGMDAAPDAACVYARDHHKVQPLFALYSLKACEQLLKSARVAAHVHASPLRWHLELGAKPVDFRDQTEAFHNLNALTDFKAYEQAHPPAPPYYPTRISLESALELVAARAAQHRLPVETVPLALAQGGVLVEDVHAPHDLPPFANSAMDGYALCGADLPTEGQRALTLVGEVFAGAASAPAIARGECARITTGAPLPAGADTVVIKENVTAEERQIIIRAGERAGGNVRMAGEDYAQGELAFTAGTPLGAAQLAVLAAFGIVKVAIRRTPRITVIATGNELVQAGEPLGFGQIHESNATLLAAQARQAGMRVLAQPCVRDDPDALRTALLEAAAESDLIVTSGGVSAGEADHLPDVLRNIGETHFHKVLVKPGMPTLFGAIGACVYFGLPGNPVASAVTFRVFVRFAMRAMMGLTVVPKPACARLAVPVHKQHTRAEFARCSLAIDDEGVQWVTPHAKQGSGMLRGLAESAVLALLPEGPHEYLHGDIVTLWPD